MKFENRDKQVIRRVSLNLNDLANNPRITLAVYKLENILTEVAPMDEEYLDIIKHKQVVIQKYQSIFSKEHIPFLTAAEFKDFLPFRNNHHWTQLPRVGGYIVQEMPKLREALSLLIDESIPVRERLNQIRPERYWGEHAMIPFLGMPVLTAILLINYPEKYGVWNNTSDAAMENRNIRLWENRWNKMKSGDVYIEMNAIFNELCSQLKVDLWTMDALWWVLMNNQNGVNHA